MKLLLRKQHENMVHYYQDVILNVNMTINWSCSELFSEKNSLVRRVVKMKWY